MWYAVGVLSRTPASVAVRLTPSVIVSCTGEDVDKPLLPRDRPVVCVCHGTHAELLGLGGVHGVRRLRRP